MDAGYNEDALGRTRFAPFLPRRIRLRCPRWVGGAFAALLATGLLGCGHALAGSSARTLPNLPVWTAGGNQLWADLAWDDGWRVQRHVWTGHARLLDDGDVRRAWGAEGACLARLSERRARGEAAVGREKTVVLMHGLWRTRDSMGVLAHAFEGAGYDVINVAYPSTRASIAEHAAQLAALLGRLPGEDREISFVTHSLGGLVVRALLERDGDGWRERHRPHRAVFIAAPNGGAQMARMARHVPGALALYGKPSRELALRKTDDLAVPSIPFATIAAGRGNGGGWNPFVPGDDDGVVGVEEARLAGAATALLVEGVHTFVMRDPDVVEAALEFIGSQDTARGEVRGG